MMKMAIKILDRHPRDVSIRAWSPTERSSIVLDTFSFGARRTKIAPAKDLLCVTEGACVATIGHVTARAS
jgi:hypothetical protein